MNCPEAENQPLLLLVDDDPSNLRLIGDVLAGSYQVTVATSGEVALRLAQEQLPDLVLMDVVLPGITGLEACRRLGANPATSDIPVIFITGGTTEYDELACWDAGGVDYVSKPIHPTTLTRRIAVHIKLKQQADRLRMLAGTDPLTGLANRRTFDLNLTTEWRRCQRLGAPISVAILDADWFKRFNDRYGHEGGDRVLRMLATTMQEVCSRASDTVARLGGEEFCILMPNTGEEGASILIERVLGRIAELCEPHADSPFGRLTVSAGIATLIPRDGREASDLMATADKRLYKAKAAGRAQACSSD